MEYRNADAPLESLSAADEVVLLFWALKNLGALRRALPSLTHRQIRAAVEGYARTHPRRGQHMLRLLKQCEVAETEMAAAAAAAGAWYQPTARLN